MCAQMDSILAQERAQLLKIVNRRKSYDTRNLEEMAAYSKAFSDWNNIDKHPEREAELQRRAQNHWHVLQNKMSAAVLKK